MARTEVTREINGYIRQHSLQDKDNGRKINPDKALASLLKIPMAEVFEVATFYAHFDVIEDDDPIPPEITIRVCDSLTCELNGSDTLIKDLKKKVGVSLNPESKIELITEFLDKIDLVLIMSVNPGFGGQKFMPEVLDKIKQLKKIQQDKDLNFDIEIDGGINFENCKIAIDAGANILVSGTTVFKSNDGDIKKNINLLKLK